MAEHSRIEWTSASWNPVLRPDLARLRALLRQDVRRALARHPRPPVALPADSSVVVLEDGALAFADSTGSVVGGLSAPLARDAAGNPLRTYFTTNGISVTQHIDFDSSTAFPIVADHWYQPWKWGIWKSRGVRGCTVWGAGGAIAGSRGGPWGAGLGAVGGCFAGAVSAYWH